MLDVVKDAINPIGIYQCNTVNIERNQKAKTEASKELQTHKIDPQPVEAEREFIIPREKGCDECRLQSIIMNLNLIL